MFVPWLTYYIALFFCSTIFRNWKEKLFFYQYFVFILFGPASFSTKKSINWKMSPHNYNLIVRNAYFRHQYTQFCEFLHALPQISIELYGVIPWKTICFPHTMFWNSMKTLFKTAMKGVANNQLWDIKCCTYVGFWRYILYRSSYHQFG